MPGSESLYSIVQPGIYRHSKTGKLYQVLGTARDDKDGRVVIVYIGLYQHPERGYGAWSTRDVEDFIAMVEVDGTEVPRFTWVGVPGENAAAENAEREAERG